jgi:excisionase family DNA binding protein
MAGTVRIPASQNDRSDGPRLGRSVSIDQAAELLGVSRRTVYNRIREGRLLTIRTLGGSQRVLIESLSAPPAMSPRSYVSGFGG